MKTPKVLSSIALALLTVSISTAEPSLRSVSRVLDEPPRWVVTSYRPDGTMAKRSVKMLTEEDDRQREPIWADHQITVIEDRDLSSPLRWDAAPGGTLYQWFAENGSTIIFQRQTDGVRFAHRAGTLEWVSGPGVAPGEQAEQNDSAEPASNSAPASTSTSSPPEEDSPETVVPEPQFENAPHSVSVSTAPKLKSGRVGGEPAAAAPQDLNLTQLTTLLQEYYDRIEAVHGFGREKAQTTLREEMKAAGVTDGMRFSTSWADWHSLHVIKQVRPRLRPVLGSLKASLKKQNLSKAERASLKRRASAALSIAAEMEELLNTRMDGLVQSAKYWDRIIQLGNQSRTSPGYRQLQAERDRNSRVAIQAPTDKLKSLPYPK